ncbi:MAG: nucleotidyltransferase family protein [Pseudomonadota bacterium]
MTPDPLVLQAFRDPECVRHFSLVDWDLALRQAGSGKLVASLAMVLEDSGLLPTLPQQARAHLAWSLTQAERHGQAVRWEVAQIRAALADCGVPFILLKGAAYHMAQLPAARGRLFSDIDILVPKADLDQVEAALMMHGWISTHHDAYDQRYYREWMHELPPMQHVRRESLIDVHHAILPETSAARPDPEKLRAAALPLGALAGVSVFSPHDLVLHSAVHLFYDGELDHGMRDLIDIDRLLRHYAGAPGFWDALAARAVELEVGRPLFYALRYVSQMLGSPIPAAALAASAAAAPPAMLLGLMDRLFGRALLPAHASCDDAWTACARFLLYLRANWLRMPPLMLARHLFHKAFLSPKPE